MTERTNVPGSQMRNLGKWVVNWTTGRWIQVVGQWEMTSWDWFIEHFTKTNLMFDHPEGQEQYRSGGFDRLLKPWEGTPTLDQIVEEGRRAPFVLQETVGVPAGSAPVYLESLRSAGAVIERAGRGMALHGAYEVLLRDESEVLVQWAFANLSSFTEAVGNTRGFHELAAWREEAPPPNGRTSPPCWNQRSGRLCVEASRRHKCARRHLVAPVCWPCRLQRILRR